VIPGAAARLDGTAAQASPAAQDDTAAAAQDDTAAEAQDDTAAEARHDNRNEAAAETQDDTASAVQGAPEKRALPGATAAGKPAARPHGPVRPRLLPHLPARVDAPPAWDGSSPRFADGRCWP